MLGDVPSDESARPFARTLSNVAANFFDDCNCMATGVYDLFFFWIFSLHCFIVSGYLVLKESVMTILLVAITRMAFCLVVALV